MTTTQLPQITKRYATTLIGGLGGRTRKECWAATTVDGEWEIERLDERGTPWIITNRTTARVVPMLMRSGDEPWKQSGPHTYGSLRKALTAIATGAAMRLIEMEGTTNPYITKGA